MKLMQYCNLNGKQETVQHVMNMMYQTLTIEISK
jgi:hypothetical protein